MQGNRQSGGGSGKAGLEGWACPWRPIPWCLPCPCDVGSLSSLPLLFSLHPCCLPLHLLLRLPPSLPCISKHRTSRRKSHRFPGLCLGAENRAPGWRQVPLLVRLAPQAPPGLCRCPPPSLPLPKKGFLPRRETFQMNHCQSAFSTSNGSVGHSSCSFILPYLSEMEPSSG